MPGGASFLTPYSVALININEPKWNEFKIQYPHQYEKLVKFLKRVGLENIQYKKLSAYSDFSNS